MTIITITGQIDGYTYLTAFNADMGVTADYIIYDYSTNEEFDICAELDTIDGFEPDYTLEVQNWSADGYSSIEGAKQAIEYHFDKMIKHYRKAWLGL